MTKKILLILILICVMYSINTGRSHRSIVEGLIAEDTSGDYATYLNIASCVKNRIKKGMPYGLVALKRRDLNAFIKKECIYALKVKNIDLRSQAKKAISEVFILNKDYCDGATYYEHTGVYPIPKYTKNMKVVKVLYAGTKNEITFWREK